MKMIFKKNLIKVCKIETNFLKPNSFSSVAAIHSYSRLNDRKHIFSAANDSSLLKIYDDPERSLNHLVGHGLHLNPSYKPQHRLEKMQFMDGWNCELSIKWPVQFKTSGKSNDKEMAKRLAYLSACSMYQKLGFFDKSGEENDCTEMLNSLQDRYTVKPHLRPSLEYHSSRERGREWLWESHLCMSVPTYIETRGMGPTQKSAEYIAATQAVLKLWVLGYIKPFGRLNVDLGLKLPYSTEASSATNADYEVVADAGYFGYGAYLLCNEDLKKVAWFSQLWDLFTSKDGIPRGSSNYLEFYCVVEAIFTWKHKFEDKIVFVHSDNRLVVEQINYGVRHSSPTGKLYQLLRDTCKDYNIKLRAFHRRRLDNQAAHALSIGDLDFFRSSVPNAFDTPKKKKSLSFLKPFVDANGKRITDTSAKNQRRK